MKITIDVSRTSSVRKFIRAIVRARDVHAISWTLAQIAGLLKDEGHHEAADLIGESWKRAPSMARRFQATPGSRKTMP